MPIMFHNDKYGSMDPCATWNPWIHGIHGSMDPCFNGTMCHMHLWTRGSMDPCFNGTMCHMDLWTRGSMDPWYPWIHMDPSNFNVFFTHGRGPFCKAAWTFLQFELYVQVDPTWTHMDPSGGERRRVRRHEGPIGGIAQGLRCVHKQEL